MPSVKRIRIAGAEKTATSEPSAPLPRIARLMALAIWFDELIRTGEVESYAELARIGGVSRARVTQIMDLMNLPPAIQEATIRPSNPATSERALRRDAQSALWSQLAERRLARSSQLVA